MVMDTTYNFTGFRTLTIDTAMNIFQYTLPPSINHISSSKYNYVDQIKSKETKELKMIKISTIELI